MDPAAPSGASRPPRRGWAWATVALAVAFVVAVATSTSTTRSSPSPVMPAMTMSPGQTMTDTGTAAGSTPTRSFSVLDIRGRGLTVPGGRPGVAVFVGARCRACARTVGAAARGLRLAARPATLLVVGIAPRTRARDLDAVARAAGRPSARYVLDARQSPLRTAFGVAGPAMVVVYDIRGRVIGRPRASAPQIARALRIAAQGSRARQPGAAAGP